MTFALLLRNWKLIVGGLALASLGILLAFSRMDTQHWKKVAGQNAEKYAMEQLSHAVTRQSVATLERVLGEQNAAIDKLNADSSARIKAGADALAAVKQGRVGTEKAVAALQASAGRNIGADEPCVSSAAFRAAGKDL
jgi:hypothetical protein